LIIKQRHLNIILNLQLYFGKIARVNNMMQQEGITMKEIQVRYKYIGK